MGDLMEFVVLKHHHLTLFYVLSISIGVFVGGLETITTALLASFVNEDQANVFACHQIANSFGWALVFVLFTVFGLAASLPLAVFSVVLAAISVVTVKFWPGPRIPTVSCN